MIQIDLGVEMLLLLCSVRLIGFGAWYRTGTGISSDTIRRSR